MNAESCKESSVSNVFWQNVEALAFTDPLHACLYGETMPQAKSSMFPQAVEEDGFTHLRQRGMSAPDSWLNFRCTLSSCLVRISSWGMMAAELSLSKLSLRLLREQKKCIYSGSQCCVLFRLQILKDTGKNLLWRQRHTWVFTTPAEIQPHSGSSSPWFGNLGSELMHIHGASLPSIKKN